MKKLGATLVVMALFALAGCNKDKGGTANAKFSITGPTMATPISQGKSANIDLTVKKDKNFKQDIELKITNKPDDLECTLDPPVVKASDADNMTVILKVTAPKTAKVGDHTITVTAIPKEGDKASVDVKVKVEK
jgi:uncharacterized membrane protein